MNVVDSCGWLEYFGNLGNAEFFIPIIRDTQNLIVPTITLFEVFKRLLVERGQDDALEAVAIMKEGLVIDLDENIALSAALISAEMKLPMADSIILATAQVHEAILWTQDEHFKNFSGVRYISKIDGR
jgi:predicted nucleic acid-binding protein